MKAVFSMTMCLIFILSSQVPWAQANQGAIQHGAEHYILLKQHWAIIGCSYAFKKTGDQDAS